MIALSPVAERHLAELTQFYAIRERDDAIDNLARSLERACARYLNFEGQFYDAPRPYPTLLRPGWRWTKEGRYWIAISQTQDEPVIRAIFYETANIPDRL